MARFNQLRGNNMKFQATTGDLVYKFDADSYTDARHWVINHLDTGDNMNWTITKQEIEIYGFKDTKSSAGNGVHYFVNPLDVVKMNVWFNYYGNPSYGMHMKDGTTYLLIDDYGAMNDLNHLSRIDVDRKKDLV